MSLNPVIKQKYSCEKCGKEYKLHSRFLDHVCKTRPIREPKPEANYECSTCHTNYATENGLSNHRCKIKERLEQLQSPLGQAAFLFYARWMKSVGRAIPPITTFSNSRFYESFIRFAKFNKAVKLPAVEVYVQVMVAKNIGPELWCNDKAYGIYLEHVERHIDPKISVKITSDTLEKLSEEFNCEISDVFSRCSKNEIIQLIRERRLSPWLLLRSNKFKQFLGTCSSEQLTIIEELIDGNYWSRKFHENIQMAKFTSMCAKELGI